MRFPLRVLALTRARDVHSLDESDNYHLNIEQTRKDIRSQGLQVIIASNPRNPTGQVIRDGELRDLVGLARETSTTLILDEVRVHMCCKQASPLIVMCRIVLLVVHLPRERCQGCNRCRLRYISVERGVHRGCQLGKRIH